MLLIKYSFIELLNYMLFSVLLEVISGVLFKEVFLSSSYDQKLHLKLINLIQKILSLVMFLNLVGKVANSLINSIICKARIVCNRQVSYFERI